MLQHLQGLKLLYFYNLIADRSSQVHFIMSRTIIVRSIQTYRITKDQYGEPYEELSFAHLELYSGASHKGLPKLRKPLS